MSSGPSKKPGASGGGSGGSNKPTSNPTKAKETQKPPVKSAAKPSTKPPASSSQGQAEERQSTQPSGPVPKLKTKVATSPQQPTKAATPSSAVPGKGKQNVKASGSSTKGQEDEDAKTHRSPRKLDHRSQLGSQPESPPARKSPRKLDHRGSEPSTQLPDVSSFRDQGEATIRQSEGKRPPKKLQIRKGHVEKRKPRKLEVRSAENPQRAKPVPGEHARPPGKVLLPDDSSLPGHVQSKKEGKKKVTDARPPTKAPKPKTPAVPPGIERTVKNTNKKACILEAFPQELVEHIFSYTLHHQQVRYNPHDPPKTPLYARNPIAVRPPPAEPGDFRMRTSRADAYDFDLTLFRVNRSTSAEAKAYFNRVNKLILIDYAMPHFRQFVYDADIPLISDSKPLLDKLKGYTVRVKIEWEMQTMTHAEDGTPHGDNPIDYGLLLVELSELHKICFLMKILCQDTTQAGVYIISGNGAKEPLRLMTRTRNDTPTISVTLNRPKNLLDKHREQLFSDLKEITGGGHGLSVTSQDPKDPNASSEYVAELRRVMAPTLIWIHSWRMHQVDAAHKLREQVFKHFDPNDPIDSDGFEAFVLRHDDMYDLTVEWPGEVTARLFTPAGGTHVLPAEFSEEFRVMLRMASPVVFATIAENISMLLLVGDWIAADPVGRARIMMNFLNRRFNDPWVPWTSMQYVQYWHLELLVYMAEQAHQQINDVRTELQALLDEIDKYWVTPDWVVHDLVILKDLLDVTNNPTGGTTTVQAALQQMELYANGFYQYAPSRLPTIDLKGYEGWQDVKALEETLKQADMTTIHQEQKANGFALTPFSSQKDKEHPGKYIVHKCEFCTKTKASAK